MEKKNKRDQLIKKYVSTLDNPTVDTMWAALSIMIEDYLKNTKSVDSKEE